MFPRLAAAEDASYPYGVVAEKDLLVESGAGRPELLPHLQLDELLAELQARLQAVLGTRDRMRGLLEAVVAIGSGLDLESTLARIVETAVGLVDATYGALGVIGDDRRLAEFIPVGLTQDEIGRIHHWPEGRGLLGLLIDDPRPLRLADISTTPRRRVSPSGHPPMHGFLGVPVRVRDVVFGNLYLTGKRGGGEFTEDDEAVLVALGAAAGVAVENARLYEEARRQQRWIQASAEVTTRLLSGSEPADVLADITRRALELSGADLAMLALPDEEGRRLTITHADGEGADAVRDLVLPAGESLSGRVLATGEPVSSADFAADERAAQAARGAMSQIGPAIVFPLGAPGNVRGVLTVGRRHGAASFPQAQADVVASFAAQAGVALELAASRAEAERLSLYEDRDRIARDLHDLVIQRLYATGMSLEGTMSMITRPEVASRVTNAVDAMDETIKEIRAAIFGAAGPGRCRPVGPARRHRDAGRGDDAGTWLRAVAAAGIRARRPGRPGRGRAGARRAARGTVQRGPPRGRQSGRRERGCRPGRHPGRSGHRQRNRPAARGQAQQRAAQPGRPRREARR